MRKLIIYLFIIILAGFGLNAYCEIENIQLDMRDYDSIEVPAGTFISVVNTQEISTQTCSEGYKVKFIAVNDIFLHDTKIIPQGTEFYGYIEKMNEPVVGTNASMKIKITKLVLADGFEIPIRGYIYSPNGNVIGGGLSAPAEWRKIPHYQTKFKRATLEMRPGATRKMGTHTTIRPGEDKLIILTDSAWISHTLTN